MRYVVCVELYEVSCNMRLTPRPVAMILFSLASGVRASLTNTHTHTLFLSHTHTHIARAGSLLALRRQLLVDYVLSRAKARGPEAVP
jgi:small basic protein